MFSIERPSDDVSCRIHPTIQLPLTHMDHMQGWECSGAKNKYHLNSGTFLSTSTDVLHRMIKMDIKFYEDDTSQGRACKIYLYTETHLPINQSAAGGPECRALIGPSKLLVFVVCCDTTLCPPARALSSWHHVCRLLNQSVRIICTACTCMNVWMSSFTLVHNEYSRCFRGLMDSSPEKALMTERR